MTLLTRRRFSRLAAALPFALSAPHIARAEQPLRMIVVVPPGATMDTIVRVVADKLPPLLGRSVLVEYRPGGTGLVAGSFMKSTSPDGSHILFSPISVAAFFPFLYSSLPYDPERDLAPVCEGAFAANALVASNGTGASTLKDYVEAVRRDPHLGSVGTSSLGSVGAFLVTLLRKTTGADIRLVAYRGGQPLLTDLIGNHVSAGQSVLSDYLDSHRSGLVRILGVTTEQRSKLAPDIPTFKEQSFAELHGQTYMGFFVRGGTAQGLVTQYAAALTKVLAMPDVASRLATLGVEATGGTPEQFAQTLKRERERWEPVAREAGIKLS
ncbi:tripartite tricarboxylate transporter substrate-binding protein [Bradyrhizobium sp. LHD-71]|uniref:Bug family tripartite tricarboxylate transporter substrate binding protein n=1 Tax=Bradyrhizobium sp. LHD-71 TaxID=3072141 RepID=UPI00280FF91D|nr:tripartite tricarboxylate transporter substrate-binding protein [Bradyrhizobium sp. LHD-71]MDQ8729221.1 tripartite tricarboxylate transporter substrate-binding protein [Bradyrhizobium sp. LHD-71]